MFSLFLAWVELPSCSCGVINSLRPSDAIWWLRSGSTLAQVMACYLTAPSHYLNQCWLIIRRVLWHSSENSFAGIAQGINSGYEFQKDILKIIFKSPRCQWVKWSIWCFLCCWSDVRCQDVHVTSFIQKPMKSKWLCSTRFCEGKSSSISCRTPTVHVHVQSIPYNSGSNFQLVKIHVMKMLRYWAGWIRDVISGNYGIKHYVYINM